MIPDDRVPLAPALHPVLGIAFINFIFLIILMIVFSSFFAAPSGFEIKMPALMPAQEEENHIAIQVTGENVLYLNGKVVTMNELKRMLLKTNVINPLIYIQVDRRASMGRVVDVWDLCRGLGMARIKITAGS